MAATKGRSALVASMVVSLGLVASAVHAAATAEQKCQAERAKAAGAYTLCQQQAHAKFWTSGGQDYSEGFFKCRVKYMGTWAKLQGKRALAGSSCIGARFTDNGATVTDNLTGLQWEKKTNLDNTTNFADQHDADNFYTWCSLDSFGYSCPTADAADGTSFTDLLRSLNSGGCFAGHCDWRLPTRDELQTILADATSAFTCTPLCIDATFGPTQAGYYWSATSLAGGSSYAWYVDFLSGRVGSSDGGIGSFEGGYGGLPIYYARGVRGGL